jgi:hypothetical protein
VHLIIIMTIETEISNIHNTHTRVLSLCNGPKNAKSTIKIEFKFEI